MEKKEAMRKPIRIEKPQILLIQETKLQGDEALREMKQIWNPSSGVTLSARGTSGAICTIWNTQIFKEEQRVDSKHWTLVKLKNLQTCITYPICNVYIPNNFWEKKDCWETLMKSKELDAQENCIIAEDLNTTMHQREKKGGSIVRDQFRENMDDLVSDLDLFDVQPSKGKYTWNNKRTWVVHIAARLDHFLIRSPLLFLPFTITSQLVPWGISDHHPITLTLAKAKNLGPIPFRFNPLWMDSPEFLPLITSAWSTWVNGTSVYIWEKKLKKTKQYLKEWAKASCPSTKEEVKWHKQKLE
jgi:exonuclease III